jgi:hypothetical protein
MYLILLHFSVLQPSCARCALAILRHEAVSFAGFRIAARAEPVRFGELHYPKIQRLQSLECRRPSKFGIEPGIDALEKRLPWPTLNYRTVPRKTISAFAIHENR